MQKYDIVKRPLVTERAIGSAETDNIYIFRVDPRANKVQIKEAVEEIYGVNVLGVKTSNMRGKPKNYRRIHRSKASNWKKAFVKLRENDYIDLI